MPDTLERPGLGVVIRFRDSERTLPGVLAALKSQSQPPDEIVAVDSGSRDASPEMLRASGARVVPFNEPYHHARALNFGAGCCPLQWVLALSSHTVLRDPSTLQRMRAAIEDPETACVSLRWDDDPYYSEAVDFAELNRRGLKFGSIYSNSMGLFRRELWRAVPFDETLVTMEDYAWALTQAARGRVIRRLRLDFDYQRGGRSRDFTFAAIAFRLAARHRLRVVWLGPRATLREILRLAGKKGDPMEPQARAKELQLHRDRLRAWLLWRLVNPSNER